MKTKIGDMFISVNNMVYIIEYSGFSYITDTGYIGFLNCPFFSIFNDTYLGNAITNIWVKK